MSANSKNKRNVLNIKYTRFKKKKKNGTDVWKFAITSQRGRLRAFPGVAGATRISALQLRRADRLALQGVWTTGQSGDRPQAKPPEPGPCPHCGRGQSNCTQCQQLTHWIHRGAVCSTCRLYPPTSCWPGCSSWQANTHNTTSLSFLKHCVGSSLLGKSNTNNNTCNFTPFNHYWGDFCKASVNTHTHTHTHTPRNVCTHW